ncbi:MAG: hypothetical protein LBI74_06325 [Synergistaceae bacterium]|nr:hypothetical protein [Synergistaceae bacterium]
MDRTDIEDRIRHAARNTDSLIVKLDTLTGRIDTARMNENKELVEYYEKQFAEVSVEFMDGVETILDDWYALNGASRPSADQEVLDGDTLDVIHSTVVDIVQGKPVTPRLPRYAVKAGPPADGDNPLPSAMLTEEPAERMAVPTRTVRKGHGSKVDITG